jgi:mRNA interferase HigB
MLGQQRRRHPASHQGSRKPAERGAQQALKAALDVWFAEVRNADWKSSAEVRCLYGLASIVSADRIVFNIKGNDYRLVASADFEKGIVWIKWVGTHRDYDRIDVRRVEHGGS